MWKIFKELTGERHIKSDNQLDICDLNKSSDRQLNDVMLPVPTGLIRFPLKLMFENVFSQLTRFNV